MMQNAPNLLSEALAPFAHPSFLAVALGALVLGALTGISGVFLVLSRRSLMGDVLAHAAVPGMALAWLVSRENAQWVFTVGAIVSLGLAWLVIAKLSAHRSLHADAALSCTLALFFGTGLVLLTECAKRPGFGETGLERMFLGSLATILPEETKLGLAILMVFVAFLFATWPTLVRALFDPEGSRLRGLPVRLLHVVLASLLLLSLAHGMRNLGILLLLSLCVIPAMFARHLTHHLANMCLLSSLFGAAFCLVGGGWSALPNGPPTGPSIVLVASVAFVTYVAARRCIPMLTHARARVFPREERPRAPWI
jgi:manganese/zinc/iron transport system permease protein